MGPEKPLCAFVCNAGNKMLACINTRVPTFLIFSFIPLKDTAYPLRYVVTIALLRFIVVIFKECYNHLNPS